MTELIFFIFIVFQFQSLKVLYPTGSSLMKIRLKSNAFFSAYFNILIPNVVDKK